MQKVIIADTSCLILLDKIELLDLLSKLFNIITITEEIAFEFGKDLPAFFRITNPSNKIYQTILEASLDKGEASALALAMEHENSLLIIDDLKGRNYAKSLNISITGTAGILVEAKLSGYLPSLLPVITKIKETNFRLSPKLEEAILKKAGE